MNIHLGGGTDISEPASENSGAVLFPSSPDQMPGSRYARMLWAISSEMPENYNDMIAMVGGGGTPPFRAVVFNGHAGDLAAMMNIGSVNSVML